MQDKFTSGAGARYLQLRDSAFEVCDARFLFLNVRLLVLHPPCGCLWPTVSNTMDRAPPCMTLRGIRILRMPDYRICLLWSKRCGIIGPLRRRAGESPTYQHALQWPTATAKDPGEATLHLEFGPCLVGSLMMKQLW